MCNPIIFETSTCANETFTQSTPVSSVNKCVFILRGTLNLFEGGHCLYDTRGRDNTRTNLPCLSLTTGHQSSGKKHSIPVMLVAAWLSRMTHQQPPKAKVPFDVRLLVEWFPKSDPKMTSLRGRLRTVTRLDSYIRVIGSSRRHYHVLPHHTLSNNYPMEMYTCKCIFWGVIFWSFF